MIKFLKTGSAQTAVILSLVLFGSCADVRVKNYFLPKDFQGNVAIIYTPDGIIQDVPQNWTIPKDGLLKTPYEFREGNYYINYYQLKSDNTYDTLLALVPGHEPGLSKNMIVFPRTLSFTKHKSNRVVHVTTFYVGRSTASELSIDRFHFERKLEKLVIDW